MKIYAQGTCAIGIYAQGISDFADSGESNPIYWVLK